MKVRKIDVMSLAKIQAIMMAFYGLLVGLIFALLGPAIKGMMQNNVLQGAMMQYPFGTMGSMGAASIIVLPITYAIGGFVMGAVFAFVYNIVAGWVGGVELDLIK